MTMADAIAVMNRGRIEQLGAPEELYERPRTAFVAGFLGASNLLRASCKAPIRCVLPTAPSCVRYGRQTGPVSAGVRPEKIALWARGRAKQPHGTVAETAYIGVATQLVVDTPAGTVQVFAQTSTPARAHPPRDRRSRSAGAPSPHSSSRSYFEKEEEHEHRDHEEAANPARRGRSDRAVASRPARACGGGGGGWRTEAS